MSDHPAEAYGIRPAGHPVDGGYARLDDIASLAEAGVAALAPAPAPRAAPG